MKYCQSPNCHWYNTQDRLKGSGENKSYQTRKASKFYFGNGTLTKGKVWYHYYDTGTDPEDIDECRNLNSDIITTEF